MARDLAIVSGFTGLNISHLFLSAVVIGEHPVACAPYMLVPFSGTIPSISNSFIAFQTFVRREPLAIGTTTCLGALQPSCSIISNARDFEPSE